MGAKLFKGVLCLSLLAAIPALASPTTQLKLDTDHSCYNLNDTVTVTLSMLNLPPAQPAAGFQAFIAFDPVKLQWLTTTYNTAVFGQVILSGTPSGGNINLAAGILPGSQSPTSADSLLVTLTFKANAQTCAGTAVTFRTNAQPPSRITDANLHAITPLGLIDTPVVPIIASNPTLTTGSIANCYSNIGDAKNAAIAATTATDACNNTLTVTAADDGQICPATISVSATDCAGNTATGTYTTKILSSGPTVNTGSIASCYGSVGAAKTAAIGATTATDSCGASLTVTATDDGNTCPATITVSATDCLGQTSSKTYTTKIITAPPTVTTTNINACYGSVATAKAAAVAATTATDSCGASLTVTATDDGNTCPATITVSATDCLGQTSSKTYTTKIITVPPTVTTTSINACYGGVATAKAAAIAATTATDSCGASLTVTATDDGSTCPATITVSATDCLGQTSSKTYTTKIITVPPTVTTTSINACYGGVVTAKAAAIAATTATDSCGASLTVTATDDGNTCPVTITVSATDCLGQTTSGTYTAKVLTADPTIHKGTLAQCYSSVADAKAAAIAQTTAEDACLDPLTVTASASGATCDATITVSATDCAGRTSTDTYEHINIITSAPTLSCPTNVSVNADAGQCTAVINLIAPTATVCDSTLTATGTRSDSQLLSDPYPQGDTTVTWSITDCAGHTATCDQTATVSAFNELKVSVQLAGVHAPIAGPALVLHRCITFELSNCPTPTVVEQVLTFNSADSSHDAVATNAIVLVPCGSYTCITARDRLHTLRRRDNDDFGISGTQYVADFTNKSPSGDDDSLIGGNLNDDEFVDILDFGGYAGQYNHVYTDPNPLDGGGPGDTDCSTLAPHADISGNGTVFTEDFTFILTNFLKARENGCCNAPISLTLAGSTTSPRTSVSVAELKSTGKAEFAVADLNGDGVVDQTDISLWLQGARPGKPLPAPVPPRRR